MNDTQEAFEAFRSEVIRLAEAEFGARDDLDTIFLCVEYEANEAFERGDMPESFMHGEFTTNLESQRVIAADLYESIEGEGEIFDDEEIMDIYNLFGV